MYWSNQVFILWKVCISLCVLSLLYVVQGIQHDRGLFFFFSYILQRRDFRQQSSRQIIHRLFTDDDYTWSDEIKMHKNTQVLRVYPIRVFGGSIESTTYASWHDSFLLYICKGQKIVPCNLATNERIKGHGHHSSTHHVQAHSSGQLWQLCKRSILHVHARGPR